MAGLTFKVSEEVLDLLTTLPFVYTCITTAGRFWILLCGHLDDVRPKTGIISSYHFIVI